MPQGRNSTLEPKVVKKRQKDIYGFEASEGFICDVTDKSMPEIEEWQAKYPNAMKSWEKNWDAITLIFKFSADVRTVIYTTNAIESLNSTYRKRNRQRSVFPSDQALLKALYLATFEATKKWTMPIRNCGRVYGELSIMYEGRLPD